MLPMSSQVSAHDYRKDVSPVSPVPVRGRGDPAAYSPEREPLPEPLPPTMPVAESSGVGSGSATGRAGPAPAPVQPSSAALRQSLDSATADLPSGDIQSESLKVCMRFAVRCINVGKKRTSRQRLDSTTAKIAMPGHPVGEDIYG